MSKNISPKLISVSFGALLLCLMMAWYISAAWQEPTVAPPGGNVDVPLNVGATSQTKAGNLTLPNIYLNAVPPEGDINNIDELIGNNDLILRGRPGNTAPVYIEGSSVIINNDAGTGNVGIGTTNPLFKLDIVGTMHSTGDICTDAGGGKCLSAAGGGGGGAPVDASYVVIGVNGTLTQERALTGGSGISLTDGGAGGNISINSTLGTSISSSEIDDGTITSSDINTGSVQSRVTGNCIGQVMVGINANGTVTCEVDDGGSAGQWTLSGSNIYNNNSGSVDVRGSLRIGSSYKNISADSANFTFDGGIRPSGAGPTIGNSSISWDAGYFNNLYIGGWDKRITANSSDFTFDGGIMPSGAGPTLGSNGNRWSQVNTNSLCLSGTCNSSWPSPGITSCSTCDGRFVNTSGNDSMSGNLSIGGNLEVRNSGSPGIEVRSTGGGTPYIDFSNDSGSDYDVRLILTGNDTLSVQGGTISSGSGGGGTLTCQNKTYYGNLTWPTLWCDSGYKITGYFSNRWSINNLYETGVQYQNAGRIYGNVHITCCKI